MADEAGATPRELLIEAARRNNTSLLHDLFTTDPKLKSSPAAIASFLNTTTDALGASALHIAAQHGSYDVLDLILDQEGVEIDHQEQREGDTCLHKAVRYCNERSPGDEGGKAVVEILLDAGCDPRVRNKAKLRAVDLLDGRNSEVRALLQRAQAELELTSGGDVVEEDDGEEDRRDGPGSESD